MRRSARISLLIVSVASLTAGLEKTAHASGYLTARFGSDHGTPAQGNGYAIYYNPAALGGTKGTTLTGDLTLALRFAGYERSANAVSSENPTLKNNDANIRANTGKASLTNLLALPFASINTDFGTEKFRAGYAFYIPFGGMATWDRGDANPTSPGSKDGPQRWQNISGTILSIYNTFAFAYKITPNFSVGASVSPIIHYVKTARARNVDGSDDTTDQRGNLKEGRALLSATGFNIGAAAGVYWESDTKNVRFGLSYTSQPGFGQTKMTGELDTVLGTEKTSTTKINFYQSLPDIFRFGGTQRLSEKLELREDFEYVRWSQFDKQCITKEGSSCTVTPSGADPQGNVIVNVPRAWRDAIGFRLGPAFWLNEKTELFASFGMTTPANTKESIDASTIDALRFYGALGARLELSDHFAIAGSYNHIAFLNVTTNESKAYTYDKPSKNPSANGKYTSQIAMLNLNVAYTF